MPSSIPSLSRDGTNWSREETLAAFNLYCQMPFSKVDSRNKVIIALAKKMGRTPGSLSMKMGNLAWHDPKHLKSVPSGSVMEEAIDRQSVGLQHGSKIDRAIWEEFLVNQDDLIYKSEQMRAFFENETLETRAEIPEDIANLPEGIERERLVRTRVNQAFFRRAVLAAYDEKCCITGLGIPKLLNASHIVPWKENRERLNPRNGLCLNALHDRAFDRGLITVNPEGVVLVSGSLHEQAQTCRESAFVLGCDGKQIDSPRRFKPAAEFLDYHNRQVFVGV